MKYHSVPVRFETKVVRGSKGFDPLTGAVSFPIYQSATFRHPSLNETTGYDYSRQNNPTRQELEETMAALETGKSAFAFSTGMAAVAAVMDLFQVGDHVIYSEDLYGGTFRFADVLAQAHGLSFTLVDSRDIDAVRKAIRPNTKALFIESPSNPMMRVTDLKAMSELCRRKGILHIVDNTFLTPYFQRPLELGADIVLHSGTKYLAGHNDTLAGFAVTADSKIAEKLFLIQKSVGAVLAPFDSWLVLRGLKTLAIRLKRQEENALQLAQFLIKHPAVDEVFYIGLPSHPSYALSQSQSSGFGAMISFTVKKPELVEQVLGKVKVIIFAESLGGVETLITFPIKQTHTATPEELRKKLGVNDRLLRLSVGIEDVQDLRSDLDQALSG